MAGRRPKAVLLGGLTVSGLLGVMGEDVPPWLAFVAVVLGLVLAFYGIGFFFAAMVTVLMILSSDQRSQNLERVLAVVSGRRLRRLVPARPGARARRDKPEATPINGASRRPPLRPRKAPRRWLRGATVRSAVADTAATAPARHGRAPAARPGRFGDLGNLAVGPVASLVPTGATAREPKRMRKMSRPHWKRALALGIAAAGLMVPPVFAVSPSQLRHNVGDWIKLVFLGDHAWVVSTSLLLVGAGFMARLVITRSHDRAQFDYLVPEVHNGVPKQAPREIEERVLRILDDIEASDDERTHDLRLIVLTGQYSLNYLNDIARAYRARSTWMIRVLILDPDAPAVELLADGTRMNIHAGLSQLASMRATAEEEGWPVRLEWRVYSQLPVVRGYLIDDDDLFLGLTAWSGLDRLPRVDVLRLHTQGRKIAHVTARNQFGRDAIESFRTWFDYQWAWATRDVAQDA